MNAIGTKTIDTGRLVLRRLVMDDAEMMYNNWARDPQVTKYLRWTPHTTWRETAEIVYQWVLQYDDPGFYHWGICDKHSGVLMGTISIAPSNLTSDGWQMNVGPEAAPWEVSFCLGQKWWNRGYATEALDAVSKYWFAVVGGELLTAVHVSENVGANAVLMKNGFVFDHWMEDSRADGIKMTYRAYHLLRKDF